MPIFTCYNFSSSTCNATGCNWNNYHFRADGPVRLRVSVRAPSGMLSLVPSRSATTRHSRLCTLPMYGSYLVAWSSNGGLIVGIPSCDSGATTIVGSRRGLPRSVSLVTVSTPASPPHSGSERRRIHRPLVAWHHTISCSFRALSPAPLHRGISLGLHLSARW